MARTNHSGNCPKCGAWRDRLQRDHIVPQREAKRLGWSERQMHALSNIQFICANCHEDKTRIELSEKGTWNKGKPFSAESRRKMSEAAKGNTSARGNRGHTYSPEDRKKRSIALLGNTHGFKKGFTPWNKGKTGSTPWNKGMIYGEEMRKRVTGRPKLRTA